MAKTMYRMGQSIEHCGYKHLTVELHFREDRDAVKDVAQQLSYGGAVQDYVLKRVEALKGVQSDAVYYETGIGRTTADLRWQADPDCDYWYGMQIQNSSPSVRLLRFLASMVAEISKTESSYDIRPEHVIAYLNSKKSVHVRYFAQCSVWIREEADSELAIHW